jgi:polysaccharide biosynthesis protein PelA
LNIPPRRHALGCFAGAIALMCTSGIRAANAAGDRKPAWNNWIVFYGAEADCETLSAYDLIVLDPAFKGSIAKCQAKGAKALAYLSLGEISKTSAFFPLLADRAALLSENANWPGAFRVDVRNPAWRALILEKAIPTLMSRGFSGLFFDTLDTPPYLEKSNPERFPGMRDAAVDLVRSIRRRFPQALLAMNRGYDLLPDVVRDIDAVIAESFMTSHGFDDKTYLWLESASVAQHAALLRPARERTPPLPVLSLDYWDSGDAETLREIYRRERALGNIPYVGSVLLDRIIPEPRA